MSRPGGRGAGGRTTRRDREGRPARTREDRPARDGEDRPARDREDRPARRRDGRATREHTDRPARERSEENASAGRTHATEQDRTERPGRRSSSARSDGTRSDEAGSGRPDEAGPGGPRPTDTAASARSSTAVDPRFRRRRRLAAAIGVLVLLGVLAGGAWWALGEFGPGVDEVRVAGNRSITDGDLRTAAAVSDGTPLAAVDTDAVAARVAAIPGVADVDVSRHWPHTLTVTVVERTPVAVVPAADGLRLVDDTGLPYRLAPAAPPRLPRLDLPRVAADDLPTRAAVTALTLLAPPVRDQVETVSLGPTGQTLEFGLAGGRRVLWGSWNPSATEPADRRAAVLGPLLTREGTVYDVSSPNLPTVRR